MKDLIYAVLFLLLIILVDFGCNKYGFSRLNHFALGEVNELKFNGGKHGSLKAHYSFKVKDKRFIGDLSLKKIIRDFEKEKFLIGYCDGNPEINFLFLNYPIQSEAVVDSFNLCCTPKDLVKKEDIERGVHIVF